MRSLRLAMAAALAAATIALSACSPGAQVTPIDISTPEKAKGVPCDQVVSVDETINDLAAASAPGKRNQLKNWGLDPDNPEQIAATQVALDERVAQCAASPSPSPSPTATATPTATTTPAPSSTASTKLVGYVGWNQVVARPPAGLKSAVNKYSTTIGYDWLDVRRWAKTRTKDGNLVDARVILVFQQPALSATEARKLAHVEATDVPVVQVSACTDVNATTCGNTGEGTLVILAPLVTNGGVATGLKPGSGAVAGTKRLLLYEGAVIK